MDLSAYSWSVRLQKGDTSVTQQAGSKSVRSGAEPWQVDTEALPIHQLPSETSKLEAHASDEGVNSTPDESQALNALGRRKIDRCAIFKDAVVLF